MYSNKLIYLFVIKTPVVEKWLLHMRSLVAAPTHKSYIHMSYDWLHDCSTNWSVEEITRWLAAVHLSSREGQNKLKKKGKSDYITQQYIYLSEPTFVKLANDCSCLGSTKTQIWLVLDWIRTKIYFQSAIICDTKH